MTKGRSPYRLRANVTAAGIWEHDLRTHGEAQQSPMKRRTPIVNEQPFTFRGALKRSQYNFLDDRDQEASFCAPWMLEVASLRPVLGLSRVT